MKIQLVLSAMVFSCLFSVIQAQDFERFKFSADSALAKDDVIVAERFLEQAYMSASDRVKDSVGAQLAESYTMNWKFDKAKAVIEAIDENKLSAELRLQTLRCRSQGLLFFEQLDSAARLYYFIDSLALKGGENYKIQRAENLIALSRYFRIYAKTDSALYCALEAVKILERDSVKNDPAYRFALASASNFYLSQGDQLNSKKYLRLSNQGVNRTKLSKHPYYLESLFMSCQYYGMVNSMKTAEASYAFLDSITIKLYGKANAFTASCYNNHGLFLLNLLNPKGARDLLLPTLDMLKDIKMEHSMMYALALNNIGLTYVYEQNGTKADSFLALASSMTKKTWGEEQYLNGAIGYNQAYSYFGQKRYRETARELIRAGRISQRQLLSDITGLSEKAQLGVYNFSEPMFQALPSFRHLVPELADDSLNIALSDEQMLYKGMIASSQSLILLQIRNSSNPNLVARFREWTAAKRLLSAAYSLGRSKAYLDSLNNSLIEKERYLMGTIKFEPDRKTLAGADYRDVSAKLKADEIAIDFLKYRLYNGFWSDKVCYAALIITPGGAPPEFIYLCTEAELLKVIKPRYSGDSTLNKLGELYRDRRLVVKGKSSGADSLYSMIWKPLQKSLVGKKQIYYSPIGLLNLVAFPALPDENNKLLIEKFEFTQYQRLADLKNEKGLRGSEIQQAYLWGGIDYGKPAAGELVSSKTRGAGTDKKTWDFLKNTGPEVNGIQQLFAKANIPAKLFTGKEASRANLLALQITNPSILHLSTHGFYDRDSTEQPFSFFNAWSYNTVKTFSPLLRTGLVLAGANDTRSSDTADLTRSSMLTSYDMASLDLRNVKLATLSACETAMGDIENGDGVFGLQRALRQAGVGKMILSLWPVYDAQTSQFMSGFYKRVASGGSVRDAFHATQKEFSKKSAPVFWAGFVLVE